MATSDGQLSVRGWKLGIDTGGTYTDAVLVDADNRILAASKSLTTRHDLTQGISDALAGLSQADFSGISLVALSTTLSTNSVVEGKGAPVGVLLPGYKEQQVMKSGLLDIFDKELVTVLPGGHDAVGKERQPLDESRVRKAIESQKSRVAAFAVSSMFGVRNPVHEIRVRELVADPIGALSDIVDDLMGSGPSADILERLTEVWNGLFGGNDDKAETTGSGTIASVGPSVVPHACPRGDASDTGRPMSLKVQLDWGPPTIDGPSSEIAERAAGRDDKVQASVTYRGFISQTLPAANIPGFGREEPSLTVESIHWDQSNGVVEVRAYARLDCRWGINAHGRIDIPNADVPAVDEITWSHVIDDLTPGGGDKQPRLMYWASDATSAHEYYHAIDDYGAGESMVSGGDAVSTVNNRQIVDPEAELPAIMQEIHARIYQHLQDHYRSGGESRAYAATAPMFHERVAAIRARAEREGWT